MPQLGHAHIVSLNVRYEFASWRLLPTVARKLSGTDGALRQIRYGLMSPRMSEKVRDRGARCEMMTLMLDAVCCHQLSGRDWTRCPTDV
jgi:hypothetical protein